jgi:putative transcriptional regulator
MGIYIDLDVEMAKRKIKLSELAEKVGISVQNLSVLKSGRAKAIRFSTLDQICQALQCQPGDILKYSPSEKVLKTRKMPSFVEQDEASLPLFANY